MRFMTSVLFLSLSLSSIAFARPVVCENQAKVQAASDYKNQMGEVQSSQGLDIQAQLLTSLPGEARFEVAVTDESPEGDVWTFLYEVVMQLTGDGCRLKSLENLEVLD